MSFISDFISGFKDYVIQTWKNRPSTETPVSAERLNHIEAGIKSISDAIKNMASAVSKDLANMTIGASNWDAAEGEPGYVQNRTHWKEYVSKQETILEETSVSFSSNMTSLYGIGTDTVAAGKSYIVHWNDTVYECTAFYASQSTFLGNGALTSSGDDTGEPFCMEMLSATSAFVMKATKDAETIKIKVETPEVVKVHKMDKMYMPDDYTGGGGVTSWNDLEDRPFYSESGGIVAIFPVTTATPYEEATDTETFVFSDGTGFLFKDLPVGAGKTYTVRWNGADYQCVAIDTTSFGGDGSWGLGDLYTATEGGIGTESTGEPFAIVRVVDADAEPMIMCLALDGSTTITMGIFGETEKIHKLDNKYLKLDWLPTVTYSKSNVLLEETTVSIDDSNQINGLYGVTLSDLDISSYSTLDQVCVTLDGSEYICNVENTTIMPADGSASFFIMIKALYFTLGEHTIKITDYTPDYNKMPEGFLPLEGTKFYIDLLNETGDGFKALFKTYVDGELSDRATNLELIKAWNSAKLSIIDVGNNSEHIPLYVSRNGAAVVIIAEIDGEIAPTVLSTEIE